jgi:hypothetical protein
VDADLDTLATALYARIDDLLKTCPERVPWRPATGIFPQVSDAELITLAVLQALLGFVSEARWVRFARRCLRDLFPYLPGQPGYNKPLRQIIESVNDTFKGQLDLERHGGHTPAGVAARVLQRILALTAAIWHNDHTSQPVKRSLIAYDH